LVLHAQEHNLSYFISSAINNSPLLKDFQNQVESNTLDSQRILASYRPKVVASSFNSYAPVINGYGYDEAITNGGNFTTIVGGNMTFVGKKNLDNQFQSVSLLSQSARNSAKVTEQELKRTVTAQYISTYGDLLELNFNKDILDLLRKEEGILKNLTQKNVYRQTDYLTFLVIMQQQALRLRQLQVQFKSDYAQLNYLSGISDTSAMNLQDPGIMLEELPDITHSIFIKQFEIDSLKLINSKAALDFSYKPKASIFADAGFSSSMSYLPYKNFGTSFGFGVTVPIYDGHQRKLQYGKIDIEERTRGNYKSFFLSQYNQQIALLKQQLSATEELIGEINDQIRYSESLIKVNQQLLETGDAKIADYIIAFGNYLNAKNLLTQNHVNRLQIINQINYWNR
jgi:outer membrane protein TolC